MGDCFTQFVKYYSIIFQYFFTKGDFFTGWNTFFENEIAKHKIFKTVTVLVREHIYKVVTDLEIGVKEGNTEGERQS